MKRSWLTWSIVMAVLTACALALGTVWLTRPDGPGIRLGDEPPVTQPATPAPPATDEECGARLKTNHPDAKKKMIPGQPDGITLCRHWSDGRSTHLTKRVAVTDIPAFVKKANSIRLGTKTYELCPDPSDEGTASDQAIVHYPDGTVVILTDGFCSATSNGHVSGNAGEGPWLLSEAFIAEGEKAAPKPHHEKAQVRIDEGASTETTLVVEVCEIAGPITVEAKPWGVNLTAWQEKGHTGCPTEKRKVALPKPMKDPWVVSGIDGTRYVGW